MLSLEVGWLAWSHRRWVAIVIVASVTATLGLPVLLAMVVVAAVQGGLGTAGGGATLRPMPAWVVSQPFGCTGFALEPGRGDCAHFHAGIDLVAPGGTAVSSVAAGQAEVLPPAGWSGGYGLHVVVHHGGGLDTLYGHLADTSVWPGEYVIAGTQLGREGSTGASTGPHLHFEVRQAGLAVDPTRVFPGIFGPEGQPR